MKFQSTNHLMLIEPAEFYANPETLATNAYQAGAGGPDPEILRAALEEYHGFKKILLDAGLKITEGKGIKGSPDMVFPNWFFTHDSGEAILCPMLNPNRQAERTTDLVGLMKTLYPTVLDWSTYETQNRALESTASIVSDHINKRAYAALSSRTDEELARQWAAHRGYEILFFETDHMGMPVYHTDCVMWIGTTLAGICDPVITSGRDDVLKSLRETHEVVQFTAEQLSTFCGNALEVRGPNGERMLAISEGAVKSLTPAQKATIGKHFAKVLSAPLYTLEKYGGGSARCMLAELF